MHIDQMMARGKQLQQQGMPGEALRIYQSILNLDKRNVEALVNMASIQAGKGDFTQALELYRRALDIEPGIPEIWFYYGNLLAQSGDMSEAEKAFRQALSLNPELVPAMNNLAMLLHGQNRLPEAEKYFRETVKLAPGFASAHSGFGDVLVRLNRPSEAADQYQLALRHGSKNPDLYLRLGNTLADDGQIDQAVSVFNKGLSLEPASARFLLPLASLLTLTGRNRDALGCWQQVLVVDPDNREAHLNLGIIHYRLKGGPLAISQALTHLNRAVELEPQALDTNIQLGFTLAETGAISKALKISENLKSWHPDSAMTHMLAGYIAVQQARISEGLNAYRKARELEPGDGSSISNLCFSSLYSDSLLPAEVTALHKDMSGLISARITAREIPARAIGAGDKIRLGYLSPDFRSHPVGFFLQPVLENHDREQFELFGYGIQSGLDETGNALVKNLDHWHLCADVSHDDLVELMERDRLDILVDTAGYTANNRASIIARRVAPVQAVYLGYPASTGMAQMDYCIGDHALMPDGSSGLYSEQQARLENSFLCFTPQPGTPEVSPLPTATNQYITFGSCNNYSKVSDRCVRAWASILDSVAGSKLILKAQVFLDQGTCDLARSRFEALGIDGNRIITAGPTSPVAAFLGEYSAIDIALDTLPYNGGTTTCDALWMGVPVVSLAGQHFYERMGCSILRALGRPGWLAEDEETYVGIAVRLASDAGALANIRSTLRLQMASSALCDGQAFTRGLEAKYRTMLGLPA